MINTPQSLMWMEIPRVQADVMGLVSLVQNTTGFWVYCSLVLID